MNIKELRKSSGMTQQAFGDYFNIPLRTIQNWEGGQRKCPDYLLNLMQYKLENEGFLCEKVYVKIPQNFDGDLKNEVEEQLVKAHREANLLEMKQKMKDHEEWKKKHPRPKHEKKSENKKTSEI